MILLLFIGEFNSSASAVHPDPERGPDRPDQPGEHRRRPDLGRAGRRQGRARQVLPDGRAPLHAHRPEGHDSGCRAGNHHEEGWPHLGLHPERQGGLRRRPRQEHRERRRRASSRSRATRASTRRPWNSRSQASTIKTSGADCFVFSGITANGAVQLYKDVSAAVPDAKLYGPDGAAEPGFADLKEGGILADVANKVKVTVATLAPDETTPPTARSSSMTSRPSTARRTRSVRDLRV